MIAGEQLRTEKRRDIGRSAAGFALYALRRFNSDGCFAAAGALSYTTLVSLVPLAVIALGFLSAFPIFAPVREELLGMLFNKFVPTVGEQVAYWFRNFADSATQTTAIGFGGIAATGVLLLATVEDQLNRIWRVTRARPWGQRILAYWTVITLGPLLIGVSLTLSNYFEAAAHRARFAEEAILWISGGGLHWFALGVPALFEFGALTLLYWLIPYRPVRARDAALGALVATAAIELLKIGFSIYIGAVSYYQTVYGALAAIPIFLLWMYIAWSTVLLGAVVAAAPPAWRRDGPAGEAASGGVRLGLSLALVAALARAQHRGAPVPARALADELGVVPATVEGHLRPLAAAGIAAETREGGWVLACSPQTASLRDLYEASGLPLADRWADDTAAPWQRQVASAMERIVTAQNAALEVKIAALIGETIELPPRGWRPTGALFEDATPK
jgi:membrane protein